VRLLVALLLTAVLLLSGCGRLLGSGGQPVPGPTPSGTPTGIGTGIPAGPDEGSDDLDDPVTEGPDVTG
jgi:hypothetical protein